MKFSGDLWSTQFSVFGVRPEPVTGWLHVNGVNHSANRIQGGSISRAFFGEALRLKAVVVDGKTQTPSAFNTAGVASQGSEGTTYGLQLTAQFLDGKLRGEAEWGLSNADVALGDDIGKQRDQARRFKITALPFGVSLGAEYQRVGRDFISLANPTLVRDRDTVLLSAGTTLGFTTWNLGYNWGRDNVRNDENSPRVTQRGPSASFGLAIPDYPSFSLTYTRSEQFSQHVDQSTGIVPVESMTDNITAGLSYNRPQWNIFVNTGFGLQDFKKGPQDTENANLSVGFGFNPSPSFSITPAYTLNRCWLNFKSELFKV